MLKGGLQRDPVVGQGVAGRTKPEFNSKKERKHK